MKATITATARYLPNKILTNSDLEKWSTHRMSGLGHVPVYTNVG